MNKNERRFLFASEIAFNRKHREILNFNISKYEQTVINGKIKYSDFDEARHYASDIKTESISRLPEYLEMFEKKIQSRGASVHWAENGKNAIGILHRILLENKSKLMVKSKSMITEEIGLNEFAIEKQVETIETDLGEFIVQTAGEKPYHILTPAMHKSKEDVAHLFNNVFQTPGNFQPHDIAAFVRSRLRKIFPSTDVGITGANFIVADVGGIGLTENEGNGLMTISFPKIHIVFAGIERVIPSVKQLPFFFQWLGVHGTGQNISAYNTLLLGPRSSLERDGPENMHIILLNNGRINLLAEKKEFQALKCIRCGACLNVCPIYKNIGGYTYSSTYTGPIGSVITPFFEGFKEFGHLSFACTLCGRCTKVCPVEIPLHELIILNRKRKEEEYNSSPLWKAGMKTYSFVFSNRRRMDFIPGRVKNRMVKNSPGLLGNLKKMPQFTGASFSKQWSSLKI
jgi:L-lactate dehydrogenase complex protein LldF